MCRSSLASPEQPVLQPVLPLHSIPVKPTNMTVYTRWAGVRPANIASARQHIRLCHTKVQCHVASLSDSQTSNSKQIFLMILFQKKIIINHLSLGAISPKTPKKTKNF